MLGNGMIWWFMLAIVLITWIALVTMVVLLSRRIGRLEKDWAQLTSDASGGSLEDLLFDHINRVRHSVEVAEQVRSQLQALGPKVHAALQHRALFRFNAYDDVGGDQSLALVVADAHGDGVVLTCLHGRDGTRVYGKPLTGWISEYHLSEEEALALEQARGSVES